MKLRLIEFIQNLIINAGLFLKFKDTFFSHPAEPLFRVLKLLRRHGSKPLFIVDIGAADGMVSSYFSKNLKNVKIIAFEPNPEEYKKALKNNSSNRSVELRNMALSDKPGTVAMNVLSNSFSSSLLMPDRSEIDDGMAAKLSLKNTIDVTCSTLDLELRECGKIDLIKIDTQGTEISVLNGATEVLKRTKYVLIEQNNNSYYKGGCWYYEVDHFLRDRGFELGDIIVTYRTDGMVKEFDSLYVRKTYS